MTVSTQFRTTDGATALVAGAPESRLHAASTLKSIFLGCDGLRAGWRLLMFLAMSFVLLATFVLIRSGGVQGFLDDQEKAAQVTVLRQRRYLAGN